DMQDAIATIIRQLAAPLTPIPTGEGPVLRRLEGVRAVLFDVYGTLFISASGDIDAAASQDRERAFREAGALCGLIDLPDPTGAISHLDWFIKGHHRAAKAAGTAHPEVDILEIWRSVFDDL